jgi:DinB superfamily
MRPTTNYSKLLGEREPLQTIRENVARIQALVGGWTPAQFDRTYAPGKWRARQILTHLAHTELALGTRVRMALSIPDYTAQSFDQDRWIRREGGVSGRDALEVFVALSRFNGALFESLSEADRQIAMTHPEYGAISVDWIIHLLPGHQLHHLEQLERIAAEEPL